MKLDRHDIVAGLRELIRRAHDHDLGSISIRIVGGAALKLCYFERAITADIDAHIEPMDSLLPLIEDIARDRGWPSDWLNSEAAMFIPKWGQSVDWQLIFDDEHVSIAVAPVDALLAMKLSAARPGRDTEDIVNLLVLNGIQSVGSAEELFESFYPGDALPERTIRLLHRMFEMGLPPKPDRPPQPDLA